MRQTGVYCESLACSFRLRLAIPFCFTELWRDMSIPCRVALLLMTLYSPVTEVANRGPEPLDATLAPPVVLDAALPLGVETNHPLFVM